MGQYTLTHILVIIPLTLNLWSLCPYCHLWVSIPILSFIIHYTLTVICPHIKDGQCAHIHGLVYPYWASMPTYNCILIRMLMYSCNQYNCILWLGQCAHIHGLVYPYWASMPTYNCILIRMLMYSCNQYNCILWLGQCAHI